MSTTTSAQLPVLKDGVPLVDKERRVARIIMQSGKSCEEPAQPRAFCLNGRKVHRTEIFEGELLMACAPLGDQRKREEKNLGKQLKQKSLSFPDEKLICTELLLGRNKSTAEIQAV